jgi:hypothetical protein
MNGDTGANSMATDKPKEGAPSFREILSNLAAEGDFQEIFRLIKRAPRATVDLQQAFFLLEQGLKRALQDNPVKSANGLFQEMLGFNGFLMMRLQLQCSQALNADQNVDFRDRVVQDLMEKEVFKQLGQIQSNVAELCQAWATTARAWQLATKKASVPLPTATLNGAIFKNRINGNGHH